MLTTAERKRLVALLGMLGSNSEGERDNAARMAEAFRRQHGVTWTDLVNGKAVTVSGNTVIEREVEVEVVREVIVERIVYVGLLGWLQRLHQVRQQGRMRAHWQARRPWVRRRSFLRPRERI
jgi:hypothetical protein